jgi:hypothetical protein
MTIVELLEEFGYAVPEDERRRWDARLSTVGSVAARRDGPWFRARAALGGTAADTVMPELPADVLVRQSQLAGGAKFTLADDPPRWFVSAEFPMDEAQAEVAAKIGPLCEGFRQASGLFASLGRLGRSPLAGDPAADSPLDPDRRALCESVGWPLAQRAGSETAIELDVPGAYFAAAVRARGKNGLLLAVDLTVAQSSAEICRLAASVLLLHASHCVRMARATARTDGVATTYGWEVPLEGVAGEFELKHALSALSVACRLTAREVEAILQEQSLARSYLTLRGWCST